MADATQDKPWASFLLGRVIDGRRQVEAIREFATQAEAKADAEQRLLMFGQAGWGRVAADLGPRRGVVVDLFGEA
jgi:hypothetical protein